MEVATNTILGNHVFINEGVYERLNGDFEMEGQFEEFQRSYKERHWTGLQQSFGSDTSVIRELKH